ncbi:MAG: ankyrin repeat domain-containing protein [Microcoleus sp. PH2017_10_PVI_O_A]|uniref:ankyrin repeat domain-containing protein n=1 Tax=unclassified Microcoleus TaxID=2642155 RepID=UPI001D91AD9A|nr:MULTISPECIES: ankyrin repeat domain-containing protein [unclassified Microcoleus]TAE82551.1 MAG: hypothetical protein EAZ83_11850 [Oscillatoriales cyanobacterium]MCC3406639.1 ankyrin repeat domain-containing protein [Microcoleus sp. PH2017_10_PVI_O_A]MCC3460651.1 ankyrin repeat domain-containing protein [Microcoleus sp. PH2017_11_PCY_U_A]MCC3479198.1 ankyrin repeat domain-containing protein [Microcoleus sp. PH2017_12_PCY_D_A]MCC3529456.1 ankyrin repeat domain-containing protein [Microcoleus
MTQQNSIYEPPLHRAARLGNLAELKQLIARGANINSRADIATNSGSFFRQLTPLMVAASSCDGATIETLHWLIEHGADIWARSQGGTTAAWYAAGKGGWLESHKCPVMHDRVDRLEYLLNQGLDPNECSDNGRSLLSEACGVGDRACVSLLLQRGATAAPQSESAEPQSSYQIPLFCAAESGSADCVRLILEVGANPNTKDDCNSIALMYSGSPEVALVLIDAGTDIHITNNYGEDALQEILKDSDRGSERFEVARILLDAGADIERRDEYGNTRLYSVAFFLATDAVEFLLNCDVNPHAQQSEGKTPLHAVCWGADSQDAQHDSQSVVRLIDLLVRVGIGVNTPDVEGNTPVHEAAFGDGCNVTAIRTLLKHGAEQDLAAADGMTPLMLAASQGAIECVRTLLMAGANSTIADKQGMTAIDHAKKYCETMVGIDKESPNSNFCCEVISKQALQQGTECLKLLQETTHP